MAYAFVLSQLLENGAIGSKILKHGKKFEVKPVNDINSIFSLRIVYN